MGGAINPRLLHWSGKALTAGLACALSIVLFGCDDGGDFATGPVQPASDGRAVTKATCGPGDSPETGFQGQVPAPLRVLGGFKGFNCNLQLIGQSRNDGASWQHDWFVDAAGHKCNYYDTSSATANRTQLGTVVIDATNPAAPRMTTSLSTTAMIDPWESLKVNERRQMLGGVNALNGNGGPEIELFDISGDCRFPQMLTGKQVGLDDGTGQFVAAVRGHEGNFAPDGLTYYAANLGAGYIYPIDISQATRPRMLTQYFTAPGRVHGLAFSDDGNRGYIAISGTGAATRAPGTPDTNGLLILDTTEVQQRKVNPVIKVVAVNVWGDGSGAQHTILIRVAGHPYVVQVDEGGSGGNSNAGQLAACQQGLAPWNMARILDIGDETAPVVVSKLKLDMNEPGNCDKVLPDLTGLGSFTYGAHYCSVDNKQATTTLACGYFESGIRVFDIRNPAQPREIAYYNPPSVTTPSPGSRNNTNTAAGRPDHCSAQVRLNATDGTLQTTCQDNGFLSLKFTNGVWPFPTSTTPPGQQN